MDKSFKFSEEVDELEAARKYHEKILVYREQEEKKYQELLSGRFPSQYDSFEYSVFSGEEKVRNLEYSQEKFSTKEVWKCGSVEV